jgi:hypothetical protein
MQSKAIATAVVAALLTVGCGYSIKTAANYNRTAYFPDFDSFFIMTGHLSGNPRLDRRVAEDVRSTLMLKGWIEVQPNDAHTAVVINAATMDKHSDEAFYQGWGGWGLEVAGSGVTLPHDYKIGTLVIDIFDAETKQAIWRGSASDALSYDRTNNFKVTETAVSKIFDRFPPGQ